MINCAGSPARAPRVPTPITLGDTVLRIRLSWHDVIFHWHTNHSHMWPITAIDQLQHGTAHTLFIFFLWLFVDTPKKQNTICVIHDTCNTPC